MLNFVSDTTDRLDKFLASKIDVSRSRIQKAIRDGRVLVDGIIVVEPDLNVTVGNKIALPEFEDDWTRPSEIKLKIIYDSKDLAVIDKPAGLVVHPGAGNMEDTLSQALLNYFPNIKSVGDPHRPGIVHRLDEDTSGLIVVAKTTQAYEFLKEIFLNRDIEKEYIALVHGRVEKNHDFIDLPIAKAPTHRKMKIDESGKEAKTEYFVLARSENPGVDEYTLLRVKLHTGRTHQIRVHMNAIGHPLVGDKTYGKFKKQDAEIIDRQFLHAFRLKFKLMDQTFIELVSNLPQDLKKVLIRVGINYDDKLI